MRLFYSKNLWFAGLGIIFILAFLSLRPLNAPTNRIIAADGLGYYSYLPAQFIYQDQDLDFNWFDEVFNRNYDNHFFEKPTDNFMVAFHGKKINKYYPGQSLLQLPFFLIAHLCAKALSYPADGFSQPYQLAMGISGLFYAMLGLFFCRKLILQLFNEPMIAGLVPILIFFGTNLFTYTIFIGCYSHCYSFCFVTLVYYAAWMFFNAKTKKAQWFLLTFLFCTIVLTIRPLNIILLAGMIFFYRPGSFNAISFKAEKKWKILVLLLLICFVACYSLNIIHKQTGSFLMNTYVGEKFYFNNWDHIADNLFGFQYGILWYTPLVFICISAVFFMRQNPRVLYLLMPLLILIMIYSFWWYWNIVSRVIVDASGILAILLAFVFMQIKNNKKFFRFAMIMACFSVPFFQLKAYQLRSNILDNNYTYAKYYFKHFLTLRPVRVFPVNPKTVVQQQDYFSDFESQNGTAISTDKCFEGKQSALLNVENEFACTNTYEVPAFFSNDGFRKIRVAFWMYMAGEINNIHLVFELKRNDKSLAYIPFYIGKEQRRNHWDYFEYGIDVPKDIRHGDTFSVYFWNPERKNKAYIDNLKVEFFLTNGNDEVTLK